MTTSEAGAGHRILGSLLLAADGAGVQVHVEDLGAHLAGRERCDANALCDELEPAYADLAAEVG